MTATQERQLVLLPVNKKAKTPSSRIFATPHPNKQGWTVVDPADKCVANILQMGSRGYAVQISKRGARWRYAMIQNVTCPHKLYELARVIGSDETLED